MLRSIHLRYAVPAMLLCCSPSRSAGVEARPPAAGASEVASTSPSELHTAAETACRATAARDAPTVPPELIDSVRRLRHSVRGTFGCEWDEGKDQYFRASCREAYRELWRATDGERDHAVGQTLVRAVQRSDARTIFGALDSFGTPSLPHRTLPRDLGLRYLIFALAQPRGVVTDPAPLRRIVRYLGFYSGGGLPPYLAPWDTGADTLRTESSRRAFVCRWAEWIDEATRTSGRWVDLEANLAPDLQSRDPALLYRALHCVGRRRHLRAEARAGWLSLPELSVPERAWPYFVSLARLATPTTITEQERDRITAGRRPTFSRLDPCH